MGFTMSRGLPCGARDANTAHILGELDFIAEAKERVIEHSGPFPEEGKKYEAVLRFSDAGLALTEENWRGMFGMNVNFSGNYQRAG